ncbi:MAG: GAF domain-containing protein [Pseudomonadota bacterium]
MKPSVADSPDASADPESMGVPAGVDTAAHLTALAEIMQLIDGSGDDGTQVFQAILAKAKSLCNAQMSGLVLATAEDEAQTLAAHDGVEETVVDLFQTGQMQLDARLSYAAECIFTAKLIVHEDMRDSDLYRAGSPIVRSMVDDSKIRSVLFVPLLSGAHAIGLITVFRTRIAAFTADEVALIEAFASQAVIAVKTVQQFRELQTRLESERSTGDTLEVISRSRDDARPVFDMILKKAASMCRADAAALVLGKKGDACQSMPASYGIAAEMLAVYDSGQVPMDPDVSVGAKAILTGKPVHVKDISQTENYRTGTSIFKSVVEDNGIRTNLLVPLLGPDGGIGVLILFRKQAKPYTEDEIELVRSFAAQAVIAIQNVQQFKEIKTRTAGPRKRWNTRRPQRRCLR